jgi:hypothetical protein
MATIRLYNQNFWPPAGGLLVDLVCLVYLVSLV